MPRINTSSSDRRPQDLVPTLASLWIWCLPAALIVVAFAMWHSGVISTAVAGPLLTAGTAWIAAGCGVNARRCSRTHCIIDGILLPLLALVGLLGVLHVVTLSWNAYVNALWIIVVVSFMAEFFGVKYIRRNGT